MYAKYELSSNMRNLVIFGFSVCNIQGEIALGSHIGPDRPYTFLVKFYVFQPTSHENYSLQFIGLKFLWTVASCLNRTSIQNGYFGSSSSLCFAEISIM